jgi:hypothetical protein
MIRKTTKIYRDAIADTETTAVKKEEDPVICCK